ncbi:hypothetical protein PFISCL1PPCAC_24517 [Pristionchus fissidentatus]|uniref:Uncharacterized protein n=1 Tax=Pristionchus fissidentatus TaxID=1538716 RepID=A0AAV5WRI9_9BILA|nr:hypothetical protein PFISCL1PPCAC_24517 [Pristionchus fissidentatus]
MIPYRYSEGCTCHRCSEEKPKRNRKRTKIVSSSDSIPPTPLSSVPSTSFTPTSTPFTSTFPCVPSRPSTHYKKDSRGSYEEPRCILLLLLVLGSGVWLFSHRHSIKNSFSDDASNRPLEVLQSSFILALFAGSLASLIEVPKGKTHCLSLLIDFLDASLDLLDIAVTVEVIMILLLLDVVIDEENSSSFFSLLFSFFSSLFSSDYSRMEEIEKNKKLFAEIHPFLAVHLVIGGLIQYVITVLHHFHRSVRRYSIPLGENDRTLLNERKLK